MVCPLPQETSSEKTSRPGYFHSSTELDIIEKQKYYNMSDMCGFDQQSYLTTTSAFFLPLPFKEDNTHASETLNYRNMNVSNDSHTHTGKMKEKNKQNGGFLTHLEKNTTTRMSPTRWHTKADNSDVSLIWKANFLANVPAGERKQMLAEPLRTRRKGRDGVAVETGEQASLFTGIESACRAM